MYIYEFIAILLVEGMSSHCVQDSYRPACYKSSDLLTTSVNSSNIISYDPIRLQHQLERNKLICSSYLFCVLCLFWIVQNSSEQILYMSHVFSSHNFSLICLMKELIQLSTMFVEKIVVLRLLCVFLAFLESRPSITLFTKSHNFSLFWTRWNHSTVCRHML